MSLLVSSRNAANLKLFWFQVHSELQRKTTQNPKLALSSKLTQEPKFKREWLIKMNREYFTSSKQLRVCAEHLTEDNFEQNLAVRSLLGPSFKLRQLVLKKDAIPTILNFTMNRCNPAIGHKTTKNKRIMPAEHWASTSAISQVK